jgi:hypothetical protein
LAICRHRLDFAGAVLMRARAGPVLANDSPKATIRETAVGERGI